MTREPSELISLMREAFASIVEACKGLAEEEWDRATEVPGWTVKDNLAHLCGIEELLLGRERPGPIAEPWPPHVKNAFGAINEGDCEKRRPIPGARVLEEFRELTAERMKALDAMSEDDWAGEVPGPFGPTNPINFIGIRIADCYCHEQDIRRATGREGNLESQVARFVIGRLAQGIPRTIVKDVQAPDGSVVGFDITTGPHAPFAFRVEGDRANPSDAEPTATIRTTSAGLERLLAGRWNIGAAIADGRVTIEGDVALAKTILAEMAVTP